LLTPTKCRIASEARSGIFFFLIADHAGFHGLGSARVSRVGFGVSPKQSSIKNEVREPETGSVRAGLAVARETRALPGSLRFDTITGNRYRRRSFGPQDLHPPTASRASTGDSNL
jgi:hypothetical protein